MKRTAMCIMTAFIFMVFCAASVYAEESQLTVLDAKLEILAGQVKLTRVGSTDSDIISRSCRLYAGDLLETLRDSKTVLTYADGTTMRIKERTLIEVQPMSIRVFKGKTWYRFTKRGTEFRIETPSMVAGIRGTEFEVSVTSRQKTSISVFQGAVAANSKFGGEGALLKAGEAVSCAKDRQMSRKFEFDIVSKRAEWDDENWISAEEEDLNSLFIRYLNYKMELGPNDPRTIEAHNAAMEAKEALKASQAK